MIFSGIVNKAKLVNSERPISEETSNNVNAIAVRIIAGIKVIARSIRKASALFKHILFISFIIEAEIICGSQVDGLSELI